MIQEVEEEALFVQMMAAEEEVGLCLLILEEEVEVPSALMNKEVEEALFVLMMEEEEALGLCLLILEEEEAGELFGLLMVEEEEELDLCLLILEVEEEELVDLMVEEVAGYLILLYMGPD